MRDSGGLSTPPGRDRAQVAGALLSLTVAAVLGRGHGGGDASAVRAGDPDGRAACGLVGLGAVEGDGEAFVAGGVELDADAGEVESGERRSAAFHPMIIMARSRRSRT